jgi:regulator of RNase E activity RraA
MRTGKGRIQLVALQVPVQIGGVTVAPGDILRGDPDGVVSIPRARAAEVLDIAEDIAAHEGRIRDAIRGDMRMDEARRHFKCHDLQNPGYDEVA